jgi:hypothetical protein
MDHGKIQRPKILVERKVIEVLVDIEEERILVILRWLDITNPEKLVCKR